MFIRVLCLAIVFPIALQAADTDVKLLKKLAQHFSALGVNTANFSAEEQVSNYSEYDHKKFSEILHDFAWQVDTEIFLDGGYAGLFSAASAAAFGGMSYCLSSLSEWPSCLKYACREGTQLIYADGYRCIKPGIDSICWETISQTHKLYGKKLLEYAYYTAGCAPNLPQALLDTPTKIPVENLMEVSWNFCENWIRPSLSASSMAASTLAVGSLAVGLGKKGYDIYLMSALKKLATKEYDIGDRRKFISAASRQYPSYKGLIGFMIKYMVDRDERIHNIWKEKSTAHEKQSYFISSRLKQV